VKEIVELDISLLRYLKKTIPGSIDFITNPPKNFTYAVDYLLLDNVKPETTDLLDLKIFTGNPLVLSGIKTLDKHPWFKFIWIPDERKDNDTEGQYTDMIKPFEIIYDVLANYFPCELVTVNKQEYVIIFDDYHDYVIVDRQTNTAFYDEKRNWYKLKRKSLGRNARLECKRLTKEVRFEIDENIKITTEQLLFAKQVREGFKLHKIYNGTKNEYEKKTPTP